MDELKLIALEYTYLYDTTFYLQMDQASKYNTIYGLNSVILHYAELGISFTLNWALLHACGSGHIKIAKWLIKMGANVTHISMCAAYYGNNLDIINMLLQNGVDDLCYPFHHICRNNDMDMYNWIVNNKSAKIDWIAVYCIACEHKNAYMLQEAIEHGASLQYSYLSCGPNCSMLHMRYRH